MEAAVSFRAAHADLKCIPYAPAKRLLVLNLT